MVENNLISIGDIAKRTGTRVSAIRFYTDKELIPSVRAASGHRFFARHVIRRVSFILVAQSMGYSLDAVSKLLATLPDSRTPTKQDWQKLSRSFVVDIDEKIRSLENLKVKLDGCIGCGCLSLESCRLYNPDDLAAKFGTGARYLLGNKPPSKI
jgi:redox-sensitive transcriptional activator SoxR